MTDPERRGRATASTAGGRRSGRVLLGVLLGVQTVALVAGVLLGDHTTRAVTTTVGGEPRTLSHVDLGTAMVVVIGLIAVARFLPRGRTRFVDPLLTTPITVFVVAQANGVRDVGALVGVYALASAGVLFGVVQDGGPGRVAPAGDRSALGFGSAVGIVPWGIIAFTQVGASVVGQPVPGAVVLVTLAALVVAVAEFVATWRGRVLVATGIRIVGSSIVAWLVVAAL
ncbi:hypothetical protein [Curtobacterium sp. RRHDQ10]|uniref:hypothetical protein n=1 Tax=Curtobacterium phyllosphaerae TaxID=3413379 RepID=UPI003BF2798B